MSRFPDDRERARRALPLQDGLEALRLSLALVESGKTHQVIEV